MTGDLVVRSRFSGWRRSLGGYVRAMWRRSPDILWLALRNTLISHFSTSRQPRSSTISVEGNCELLKFPASNLNIRRDGADLIARKVFNAFLEGELAATAPFKGLPAKALKQVLASPEILLRSVIHANVVTTPLLLCRWCLCWSLRSTRQIQHSMHLATRATKSSWS